VNPCDAAFKREVRLRCYDALEAEGFTRYRKEGADWPFGGEFYCWVGLNSGLYKEYVQINPFVGVHAASLEQFWISLIKDEYPKKYDRSHATYAIHLGKIAPNEEIFRFTRETDVASEAKRLARLYLEVGLPFAKSIASYDALIPLLMKRSESLGAAPEKLAACLYLAGRVDEARFFVESFMEKHRDYIAKFAVPFLALLARSEGVV